jgi:hypothetical protein
VNHDFWIVGSSVNFFGFDVVNLERDADEEIAGDELPLGFVGHVRGDAVQDESGAIGDVSLGRF